MRECICADPINCTEVPDSTICKKHAGNLWQSTPPTEPGWYWHRLFGNAPRCLKVFLHPENGDGLRDESILYVNTMLDAIPLKRYLGGEWWPERIKEPE